MTCPRHSVVDIWRTWTKIPRHFPEEGTLAVAAVVAVVVHPSLSFLKRTRLNPILPCEIVIEIEFEIENEILIIPFPCTNENPWTMMVRTSMRMVL